MNRTFSVVALREMDGLFVSCCNRSQSADLQGQPGSPSLSSAGARGDAC